jgi:hypothetical protein
MDRLFDFVCSKITANRAALDQIYKECKHACYDSWSLWRLSEASHRKQKYVQSLQDLSAQKQPVKHAVRICIGVVVLSRYSKSCQQSCSRILLNEIQCPLPFDQPAFTEFVTYRYAKYCRLIRRFDSTFIRSMLATIGSVLASPDKRKWAYIEVLLVNLAKKATRAIDDSTIEFYQLLLEVFSHSACDVRLAGYATLNKYLSKTKQRHFPVQLHQAVGVWLKQEGQAMTPRCHGGMLILTSLLDHFGKFQPEDPYDEYGPVAAAASETGVADTYFAGTLLKIALENVSQHDSSRITCKWNLSHVDERLLLFAIQKLPGFLERSATYLIPRCQKLLTETDLRRYKDGCKILRLLFQQSAE